MSIIFLLLQRLPEPMENKKGKTAEAKYWEHFC